MEKNTICNHYTSVNIDSFFLENIVHAGKSLNLPVNRIFIDLITLADKNIRFIIAEGRLTEYQNHAPACWKKLYYQLNASEIEMFSLMRFRYRISLSKLAFIAFVLLWDVLLYTYKERLKITNTKMTYNSYEELPSIYHNIRIKFTERFKMRQKE